MGREAGLVRLYHSQVVRVRDGETLDAARDVTVLSSMDAFVSSVVSVLKERPHEDPFLIRTLYGIGNGLAEIIKRSLASLQQVVLHRRDMSLWYSPLRSKHVASLRHAPVLSATLVFPPDLVREVSETRQEDIKSKALFKAVTAGTSAPRHSLFFSGPLRQPKRQSSGGDKIWSPKGRDRLLEEGQLVYPAALETMLPLRGSPRARRIGDNHSRYCEGRDICMLSYGLSRYYLVSA